MTQTHTPTPWRLTGKATIRSDEDFSYICVLEQRNRDANAAFILRAVNAHEDLVAALKCFAHLATGEGFNELPDSHIFDLVWAGDHEDRIDEETGKRYPIITAGQLRRALAVLAKATQS